MSTKDEAIAGIQKLRDDKSAAAASAISAEYQAVLDLVSAVEITPSEDPEIAQLQAQISALQADKSALQADKVDLQAKLDAEISLEAQDQLDIAALKEHLSKDLEKAAQLKVIVDALLA